MGDFFSGTGFWCIFVAPPPRCRRLGLGPVPSLLCERDGVSGDSGVSGSWKGGSDHVGVFGSPRGLLGGGEVRLHVATDDVDALA